MHELSAQVEDPRDIMMDINRCAECEARIDEVPTLTAHYNMRGPWACRYKLTTRSCPNCRSTIRSQETPFDAAPVMWNMNVETMREGRDYKVLKCRLGGLITGRMPLDVVWWWTPFEDGINGNVINHLEMESVYTVRPSSTLLVVAPHIDPEWAFLGRGRFDQVWQLSSHMMQGARGPYPSLKAELAIRQTLCSLGLRKVTHFWPSVQLPADWYVPLGKDQELLRAWAMYARQNIKIETK